MKKIASILLVFIMLTGIVVSLASCGGISPELDFTRAKETLESRDYYVTVNKDPSDEYIKESLNAYTSDDGLYIICYESAGVAELKYKQLEQQFNAQIQNMQLEIQFYEKVLSEHRNILKSDKINEIEDDLKDLRKELNEAKENYAFGRSGNYVWYGTLTAVKASRP